MMQIKMYIKKLIALPILFTLICCSAVRDRKIINDFISVQKEVVQGDSIYINTLAVNEETIIDIYAEVLTQKESGAMIDYYYTDTLSEWPFNSEEIKALKEKSFPNHNWNLDYFDYTKTKPLKKGRAFLISYVNEGSRSVYAVSKPLVKGKTALLYFSSGVLLHGGTKYGVFVLKKINGKWQEIGQMDQIIFY